MSFSFKRNFRNEERFVTERCRRSYFIHRFFLCVQETITKDDCQARDDLENSILQFNS